MSNYFIIFCGWIIGQYCTTVICAYLLQINKEGINFPQSVAVYSKKEMGSFFIAFGGLLVLMFICSDFIDPSITREMLLHKEKLSYVDKAILYSRTFSVAYGMFCAVLLLVIFKKGIKGINEYAEKNKNSPNDKP